MAHIKIIQPGFEGYTGEIGQTTFADGVSVEHVPARQVAIIGASLAIVEFDPETGKAGGNPALQHVMIDKTCIKAPILEPLARAVDGDKDASTPAKAEADAVTFHTREQLEAIAQSKGIAGLRAIMDPLGLKAVSINKAILAILKEELKLKSKLESSGALKREDAAQSEAPADDDKVIETDEAEADETGQGESPAETDEEKAAREALEGETAAKRAEEEAKAEAARLAAQSTTTRDPQASDAGPSDRESQA